MRQLLQVPNPPEFLDPLTQLDRCYYYAVPAFYVYNDPNTRWILTMIKNNEEDRIRRKMEISPESLKGKYFQMIDHPQFYDPERVTASPMFKRRTVLYLTAVGVSIYLNRPRMTEMLLKYCDTTEEPLFKANEPQYATHVQDGTYGDFHAFPPFVAMLRTESFECAPVLLEAGWDPHAVATLPLRRKHERRVQRFSDWLDVALSLLAQRSLYPLQVAVAVMTRDLGRYHPSQMSLSRVVAEEKVPSRGLIDVDDLELKAEIFGIRSLNQLVEEYDRYQQLRRVSHQVEKLKREVTASGANLEMFMSQAEFFDAGYSEHMRKQTGKANEAGGQSQDGKFAAHNPLHGNEDPVISESSRILYFSLKKDPNCMSLQQCLDAVIVFVRREFFLLKSDTRGTASKAANMRRAQDIENAVVLLLMMIQREQEKVDAILEKIKSGVKKFSHLEEHKQLENRKLSSENSMDKMVTIMMEILVQSKKLPKYLDGSIVPNPGEWMANNLAIPNLSSQLVSQVMERVANKVGLSKRVQKYVDREMLMQLLGKGIHIPMATGKQPPKTESTGNNSNQHNQHNCAERSTTTCFVTYRKVKRKKRPSDSVSTVGSFQSSCCQSASCEIFGSVDAVAQESGDESCDSYAECLQTTDRMLDSLCREMDDLLKPMERRCRTGDTAATVAA